MGLSFAPAVMREKVRLSPQISDPVSLRSVQFNNGSAQRIQMLNNWLRRETQRLTIQRSEVQAIEDYFVDIKANWFAYKRDDIGQVWMRFVEQPRNPVIRDTAALYFDLSLAVEYYYAGHPDRWQLIDKAFSDIFSVQAAGLASAFGAKEHDGLDFGLAVAPSGRDAPTANDDGSLNLIEGGELEIDVRDEDDTNIDTPLVLAANARLAMLIEPGADGDLLLPIGGVTESRNFVAHSGYTDAEAEIRNGEDSVNTGAMAQTDAKWDALRGRTAFRSSIIARIGWEGQTSVGNLVEDSVMDITNHGGVTVNDDGSYQWKNNDTDVQYVQGTMASGTLTDDMMMVLICESRRGSDSTYPMIMTVLANNFSWRLVYNVWDEPRWQKSGGPIYPFSPLPPDNFSTNRYITGIIALRGTGHIMFAVNDGENYYKKNWIAEAGSWFTDITTVRFGGDVINNDANLSWDDRIRKGTVFLCHKDAIDLDGLSKLSVDDVAESSIGSIAMLPRDELATAATVSGWAEYANTERNKYNLIKRGKQG